MNKSNFVHGAWAVAGQTAYALITGDWITGAVFWIGFFVGIEWMQEIYIHVDATGRDWPCPLDLGDIISGFAWVNSDRFGDTGIPALMCIATYYLSGVIYGGW